MISYSQEVGQAYSSGKRSSNVLFVPFTPVDNPVPVGDTVFVHVSIKGNIPIKSVVDSVGNTYKLVGAVDQGSGLRLETWVTVTSAEMSYGQGFITVTTESSVSMVAVAEDYSGVVEFGNVTTQTGTGTQPSIVLATQDPDNWIVGAFAWSGPSSTVVETGWQCVEPPGCDSPVCCTKSIRTSPAGILRDSDMTINGGTDVGIVDNDNSSLTPGDVPNTIQLTGSAPWAAIAVELRTV